MGLAVFLTLQGLERADQWSSVLSLFLTLAGLVLSVVGFTRQGPSAGGQSADGARVGGSVRLIRNVRGHDVIINDVPPRRADRPPSRPASTEPGPEGSQSSRGASVGGDVVHIDDVSATGTLRIGEERRRDADGQGVQ